MFIKSNALLTDWSIYTQSKDLIGERFHHCKMATYFDEHDCQELREGETPDHLMHFARLLMDSGVWDQVHYYLTIMQLIRVMA